MNTFVIRVILLPSAEPDMADPQTDSTRAAHSVVLDVPLSSVQPATEGRRVQADRCIRFEGVFRLQAC